MRVEESEKTASSFLVFKERRSRSRNNEPILFLNKYYITYDHNTHDLISRGAPRFPAARSSASGTTPSNRLYVGSTRHALPLWYALARREAAPPMAAASPPCAALERAAQSKAEPRGAAL